MRPGSAVRTILFALSALLVDPRRILRIDQHDIRAPSAWMRATPSSTSFAVSAGSRLRSTALVPTCQITRSGCTSITAVCSRFIISGASSPPTAAIDDGDVGARILPLQLRSEPVRIGELRRRSSHSPASTTSRRRRSRPAGRRASLLATCGSEPSACTPPFGGRQGTRLKISLADLRDLLHLVDRLRRSASFGGGSDGSLVALLVDAGASDAAAGDDGACGEACVCAVCVGAVAFNAAWTVTCACAGSTRHRG